MQGMNLDALIEAEDALESIRDGFTKEQYVSMHKEQYRAKYGEAWGVALGLLKDYGTVRKALNRVRNDIQACV